MHLGSTERVREGRFDVIGVGGGPANLSLAALLCDENAVAPLFFERMEQTSWHSGLMFKDVGMQTSFLEDLVTPAAPTNRFSFMSFLNETGQMYNFLCRNVATISRLEFQQYLKWASRKLPCFAFGETVTDISFREARFEVHTTQRTCSARSIAIGVGKTPLVPAWADGYLSSKCFHVEEFLHRNVDLRDARIAVVGGGQSAADLMTELLGRELNNPTEIHWITRRGNLQALDNSPFVNEFHTPQYVEYFYGLSDAMKQRLLVDHKLAGDGITPACLEGLYRAVYQRKYVYGSVNAVSIHPHTEVNGITLQGDTYQVHFEHLATGYRSSTAVDFVVLCTGYDDRIPAILDNLKPRLHLTPQGRYILSKKYKIAWDGPDDNAIYALNAARHSHGIADSYLCLAAWRAAMIANSILGIERYRTYTADTLLQWSNSSGPTSTDAGPLFDWRAAGAAVANS